jgi:hypothetical protein
MALSAFHALAQSRDAAALASPRGISSGKDIDETNTGVPKGHSLVDVRSTIVVTENWIRDSNKGSRIIENRNFLSGAGLFIAVDGFTVRYCKFNGRGGLSTNANSGGLPLGKNIKVLDCEFDGNNESLGDSVAVYGSSLTLKRVHVWRWPRAMWVGDGDVWVEECYFHDLTCDGKGAHIENIYVAGGANQTYLRNKLISNAVFKGDGSQVSASLAIYNESYERGRPYPSFPHLADILVQGNYFESDGYYTFYCGALTGKSAPFAKGMVVKDNIFGRRIQRWSGKGGPAVCFDPSQAGNAWENNSWGPKGPFSAPEDPAEGALLPSPIPN